MATKEDKYEDNAAGKYYCDTECIDCDLCRETAPENFTRNDDGGYSSLQTTGNEEEEAPCQVAGKVVPWKPSATMAQTNPLSPIFSPPAGGLFYAVPSTTGPLVGVVLFLKVSRSQRLQGFSNSRPLRRGQRDKYRAHRLLIRAAGGPAMPVVARA